MSLSVNKCQLEIPDFVLSYLKSFLHMVSSVNEIQLHVGQPVFIRKRNLSSLTILYSLPDSASHMTVAILCGLHEFAHADIQRKAKNRLDLFFSEWLKWVSLWRSTSFECWKNISIILLFWYDLISPFFDGLKSPRLTFVEMLHQCLCRAHILCVHELPDTS